MVHLLPIISLIIVVISFICDMYDTHSHSRDELKSDSLHPVADQEPIFLFMGVIPALTLFIIYFIILMIKEC